jgi:hypothetical protein
VSRLRFQSMNHLCAADELWKLAPPLFPIDFAHRHVGRLEAAEGIGPAWFLKTCFGRDTCLPPIKPFLRRSRIVRCIQPSGAADHRRTYPALVGFLAASPILTERVRPKLASSFLQRMRAVSFIINGASIYWVMRLGPSITYRSLSFLESSLYRLCALAIDSLDLWHPSSRAASHTFGAPGSVYWSLKVKSLHVNQNDVRKHKERQNA